MNAINKPNEVSMFKVGDWVVRKQKYAFSCVVKITEIREHSKNVFIDYEDARGKGWGDVLKHFRHATPEEIAAGHRIDLEELRDCDTPPNCKKYER